MASNVQASTQAPPAQTAVGTLDGGAGGHAGHGQAARPGPRSRSGSVVLAAAGARAPGQSSRAPTSSVHAHDLTDLVGHCRTAGGAGVHRGLARPRWPRRSRCSQGSRSRRSWRRAGIPQWPPPADPPPRRRPWRRRPESAPNTMPSARQDAHCVLKSVVLIILPSPPLTKTFRPEKPMKARADQAGGHQGDGEAHRRPWGTC